MYQTISTVLQPKSLNSGGLSHVNIPSASPEPFPAGPDPKTWKRSWDTITNPEEIARHVCASNVHQYHQSSVTPFAMAPLATYLGTDASTDACQRKTS